ncbi:hypothetical protein [Cellulomonas rhizosphaerae]|uniref:Uncharacterized protein n=1 Tax=Cellulomonas rhizosphaerae TaxID=2293719 RepID=A0A413RJE6_9CELL|nr:hypothetical protein [Cellulomonas rhizosphaerae]RHA38715.1 hypothetical protein D1825_13355 [Cellulomonas rhizosphaerae]
MSPRPVDLTAGRVTWFPITNPDALVDDGAGRLVAMNADGVAYGIDITQHIVVGFLSPAAVPAGADAPDTTPGHDAADPAPETGDPVEDAASGLSPAAPPPPQDRP